MARRRYTTEEIIRKLRQADVLIGQGQTVADVIRHLEVSDVTYYRWRKENSGLKVDQAKRFTELEKLLQAQLRNHRSAEALLAMDELTLDR
ncbi:MAG: transposase [Cyanobacteria bacterium P01_F01_bin.3]